MPACVCVVCVRVSVYACEHVGRERACATVCLPARTVCVCLSIFKYTSRLMSLESFRKKQPLVAICVSFLDSLTVFEKTKKTKKKKDFNKCFKKGRRRIDSRGKTMLMTDRLSKSDEAWQEPPPMDFVCVLSRGIVQALCAIFRAFLRENVSVASNTKELCTRAWRTDIKGVRGVLFFFSFKGAYNAKSIDAGSFRESRGGSQASPLSCVQTTSNGS